MIRETLRVLIPRCTKPLFKVSLPTQNSQADNEQDRFVGFQFGR